MDDRRAPDQLDALIAKGEAVPERPDGQQWMSNGRRVEPQPYAEWRSQSRSFARSLLRDGHAYLLELERVTEPTITTKDQDPQTDQRECGVGVLRAIREDVANGYLSDFRGLVATEVPSTQTPSCQFGASVQPRPPGSRSRAVGSTVSSAASRPLTQKPQLQTTAGAGNSFHRASIARPLRIAAVRRRPPTRLTRHFAPPTYVSDRLISLPN